MTPTATATFEITLTLSSEYIEAMSITFQQNKKNLVRKTLDDVTWTASNVLLVELTPEETQLFEENTMVRVQIKSKTANGKTLPTEIYNISVDEILDKELL